MCDTVTVTLPGLKCMFSPLFHMNRFIIQTATQVDSTNIANTESLNEQKCLKSSFKDKYTYNLQIVYFCMIFKLISNYSS